MILASLCLVGGALAEDKAQILATAQDGFGRIVLSFPGRLDLPKHKVNYENGVLAITFDEPISILLPDIALVLPDYATIARVDPDSRGVRIGLRSNFNINRMDAGEALYIDLLPENWTGLPPSLPPEVITALAERSKRLAEEAEQARKAEEAKRLKPVATVRVGRNPTFVRVQFDWNTDAEGEFSLKPGLGTIAFDWPVPIDLGALTEELPTGIKGAKNVVTKSGSRIDLAVNDGVMPRFYRMSPTQFILDIDIAPAEGLKAALAAEAQVEQARQAADQSAKDQEQERAEQLGLQVDPHYSAPQSDGTGGAVTPTVTNVGNTVRIAFPFDGDTPAAVFRRGDVVWMVFDSSQPVAEPPKSDVLDSVAKSFEVVSAGETKVIRMDLTSDRLATLGSEGRAWVLSLGDTLLGAAEPIKLERDRDEEGRFEVTADVQRPSHVHVLRDPVVGDTLRVVTVMPPARGLARNMNYVDFSALRSAHGLVIKPLSDELDVSIEDKVALISSRAGLSLSPQKASRQLDAGNAPAFRDSYLDLGMWRADNPEVLNQRIGEGMAKAAAAEGRLRDVARLELAQLYLGNDLSYEALGVLDVLEADLKSDDLRKKLQLVRAIASTLATRPKDALEILNSGSFPEESDALLWRAIARTDAGDYAGAREDVIAAEGIIPAYPSWVQNKFLFAGLRAAVESDDTELAVQLAGLVSFATLDPEQVSFYQLMQGRTAELDGHDEDALETYGTVIAADFRPTRAEAVYRTLLLLKKSGKVDLAKATDTLAAEVLTWRGTPLEADMQSLLAQLYFAHGDYRNGFVTVREAAASFPDSAKIDDLVGEAQQTFEDLYLNGAADKLNDLDAVALYYDFRQLTPPGTRGDEMIRNLARRLVRVDLLAQAGDLLEYQVDNRLSGVAKAQVAADLALIRIADRHPEQALKVLTRTRVAGLPPQLERQRRILEARSLLDAGRSELALDLVSQLKGKDADYLRVDGYWKAKNYTMASELLEVLSTPTDASAQMTQEDRMAVIKAAVGFVLAGDDLGVSRLRSKFSDRMAQSEEWPLFDYVTQAVSTQSVELRKVAQDVASADSLDAFISSYRELYGKAAELAPEGAVAPGAA